MSTPVINNSAVAGDFDESVVRIPRHNVFLNGILHRGDSSANQGVLIVAGGSQYRVGAHRQFVHLARTLASAGIPVLRFDALGQGDSPTKRVNLDERPMDIRAAVEHFFQICPELNSITLWGLCDGASAAVLYANQDSRIGSLILVNPWLNDQSELLDQVRHYYWSNLMSRGFWQRMSNGQVNLVRSIVELAKDWFCAVCSRVQRRSEEDPWSERVLSAFEGYRGRLLLILSERDVTAQSFRQNLKERDALPEELCESPLAEPCAHSSHRLCRLMPEADHTFSKTRWKTTLAAWSLTWVEGETAHRNDEPMSE